MKRLRFVQGTVLAVIAGCSALVCAAAFGQEAKTKAPAEAERASASSEPVTPAASGDASDTWRTELSIYSWLSGISSTTARNGEETTTEVKFKDILDALDFANFAHFEAQRGKWGLFTELDFVKLSNSNEVRLKNAPIPIKIDTSGSLKQTMLELGGIRSFDGDRVGFDLLAGARYYRYDVDTKAAFFDRSITKDWVDPIVGGRLRLNLSDRWDASLRADVGGFGAGSDLSTNALAVLRYEISDRYSVGFGYRYLRLDFSKRDTELISETYGPVIGMAIRF